LQQPTAEHFSSFDEHSSNLIGNLQLDADDEPRRVGTTSRANSVRFDETANHGHWAHASRTSLDLIPRTGSGLGGHALSERSYSYKSDGRQSSAGQSVYSATSGRANSLTSHGPTTPIEPPGLAPGLFILGSVPSIIRCWLNTNFKHDTLLYAAVCTGSRTSCLDVHLVEQLGFQEQVTTGDDGVRKLRLSVYLPEAVRISGSSSRSGSPEPQLPAVAVVFTIVDEHETNPKGIQIFLGSDMLRAHNADVLFSSNQLTLYDDDRSKLQIPLVRPEDECVFNTLSTSHGNRLADTLPDATRRSAHGTSAHGNLGDKPTAVAHESDTAVPSSDEGSTGGHTNLEPRVYPGQRLSTQPGSSNTQDLSAPTVTALSGPPPTMLSSWRRDTNEKTVSGSLDWANVGKTTVSTPSYQRRDTGIKVLRPSKAGTRTPSMSTLTTATGQSRFYDDGKKKSEDGQATSSQAPVLKRSVSGEQGSENKAGVAKTRSANPVGGASAFAWLNNMSK
jgi:ubiquitin carboxyl-terminal hydrolase 4/11/15